MSRLAFIVLLGVAALALSACEGDPVTTDPVGAVTIRPIAVTPQNPHTFAGRLPYKP
jgi:hypothetical protein